jgi:hypothetical protein
MSAPFVSGIRVKGDALAVEGGGDEKITLRVQIAELWDLLRIDASPEVSVADVKARALAELRPQDFPEDYVAKFRGWEVLDEGATLRDAGMASGSTLLLHVRRRRPIK